MRTTEEIVKIISGMSRETIEKVSSGKIDFDEFFESMINGDDLPC